MLLHQSVLYILSYWVIIFFKEFQDLWPQLDLILDEGTLDSDRSGSTVLDLSENGVYRVIRQGWLVYSWLVCCKSKLLFSFHHHILLSKRLIFTALTSNAFTNCLTCTEYSELNRTIYDIYEEGLHCLAAVTSNRRYIQAVSHDIGNGERESTLW